MFLKECQQLLDMKDLFERLLRDRPMKKSIAPRCLKSGDTFVHVSGRKSDDLQRDDYHCLRPLSGRAQ